MHSSLNLFPYSSEERPLSKHNPFRSLPVILIDERAVLPQTVAVLPSMVCESKNELIQPPSPSAKSAGIRNPLDTVNQGCLS